MKQWTNDELFIINNLKQKTTKEELYTLLPNRSIKSIQSKKKKLKLKFKIVAIHKNFWKKEEKEIVKNNFLTRTKKEMEILLPNRKYINICQQAKKLNIKRNLKCKWENTDIDFLKNNYNNFSSSELEQKLNRTWIAIKLKSISLGVNRDAKFLRNSNLEILLNGSNESLYWIGFILADGHIDTILNRLSIAIALKDYIQLEKLSNYLNTSIIKYYSNCRVSCQDQTNIPKLIQLFKIKSRKTYEPPDFNLYNLNNDQWVSLFCGFIDGDGSIKKQTNRNSSRITIKCHSSWKNNLEFMENKLYSILLNTTSCKLTKINNYGYAQLSFTKNLLNNNLKKYGISLNIPLLDRKWNNIDLNFVSKYDKAIDIRNKVIELFKIGKSIKEIAKILNYSYAGIYKIVKTL